MGVGIKDILKLSGMIMSTGFTGGAAATIAPAVTFGASLIGDDEDDKDEKKWKVERVPKWIDIAKKLMNIPMKPEVKAETLKGKIRSDFIMHYGEVPKERWVEQIHSMVVIAVKGDLAVEGLK